jgi:hypothetical protein
MWRSEDLSWQRYAIVAGICLILSTQVLFQPSMVSDWPLEAAARGWFDYFVEIVCAGRRCGSRWNS